MRHRQEPARPGASGELGLIACIALVVGNMIGSGIFLLPASLAAYGPISLYGWVFTSVGALLLALIFGRLSQTTNISGGPYTYTRVAYGDFPGFLIGWGYWIGLWTGNAAIVVAIIGYLGFFFPGLADSPFTGFIIGVALVWIITVINIRGLKEASFVQIVTTVLKLMPLLAIAVLGIFWIEPANFSPFNQSKVSDISAISAAAALTLWAYLGLESATVPSAAVIEPEKTIPRATVIGVLITAAVYISVTVVAMGVMPSSELAKSTAPFADVGKIMFGPVGAVIITLGAVISSLGTLNGFTMLTGQIPYAAARDRLFPAVMGRDSKYGTPAMALVTSSLLVTVLMAMNFSKGLVEEFNFIILLAVMATLLPYAFCAFAELLIRFKGDKQLQGGELIRVCVLATLGFIYAVWALMGAGANVVAIGLVLVLSGIPVYVWVNWYENKSPQDAS